MSASEAYNIRARMAFHLRDREGFSFDELRMILALSSRWKATQLYHRGEVLHWEKAWREEQGCST